MFKQIKTIVLCAGLLASLLSAGTALAAKPKAAEAAPSAASASAPAAPAVAAPAAPVRHTGTAADLGNPQIEYARLAHPPALFVHERLKVEDRLPAAIAFLRKYFNDR